MNYLHNKIELFYYYYFIFKMSRIKRTKEFRNLLEKQWTQKYWSFIQENKAKPWFWWCISKNPNITMDIIRDNPDQPWDWHSISDNTFQIDKELFYEEHRKRYLAAYKIQQFWYKHTLSPEYAIGRKFINRKFDQCFQ